MTDQTYTMNVETAEGVKQHGFHLGTIHSVAESFVFETLRREGVRSVALYQGGKLVRIYDWRDLPEYAEGDPMEDVNYVGHPIHY